MIKRGPLRILIRLAVCGAVLAAAPAVSMQTLDPEPEMEEAFIAETARAQPRQDVPDAASPGQISAEVGLLPDTVIEGIRMKSEAVADYKGTSVYSESRAVGKLLVTARKPGNMLSEISLPCTAWLIDDDVVMTAWHCIPGLPAPLIAEGYRNSGQGQVAFGYDAESSVVDLYPITRVIASDRVLDYAIVELGVRDNARAPGKIYGVLRIFNGAAAPGTPLRMFHHPYGYYKMVLKDGTCRAFRPSAGVLETKLYHQCDTRGGSSGAPVLLYQLSYDSVGVAVPVVVGLHTRGNENGLNNAATDFNTATAMSAIVESNAYLGAISCYRDAFEIWCPDRAFKRPLSIYFEADHSDISAEAASRLDALIAYLAVHPWQRINLAGHTDRLFGAAYSVGLSQRMADSVRAYLTSRGIADASIATEAFGSSQPVTPVAEGGASAWNRRVTVSIDWNPDR